jgi:hypothetical protein
MSFLEQEKKEAKQDNQIQLCLPIFKESDISFSFGNCIMSQGLVITKLIILKPSRIRLIKDLLCLIVFSQRRNTLLD